MGQRGGGREEIIVLGGGGELVDGKRSGCEEGSWIPAQPK
jgi:hypothetical protein